jgi:ABC-type multidrug transport system ATPase subunit
MLSVSGLSVSIGAVTVVRDASLAFNEGEMCGLIGRNGAGKTTFLRALMGALPATGCNCRRMAGPCGASATCRKTGGLFRNFPSRTTSACRLGR